MEPTRNVIGFELSIDGPSADQFATVAVGKGHVVGDNAISGSPAWSLRVKKTPQKRRVRIFLAPGPLSYRLPGEFAPLREYSAGFDEEQDSKRGYYDDGLIVVGYAEVPAAQSQPAPKIERPLAFFDRPDSIANDTVCTHFGRMDQWTLSEAAALSLGKNPSVVTYDNMISPKESYISPAWAASGFLEAYKRQCDVIRRGVEAGKLDASRDLDRYDRSAWDWDSTIDPADFLSWAAVTLDPMPVKLLSTMRARSRVQADGTTDPELQARIAELEGKLAAAGRQAAVNQANRPMREDERENLYRIVRALVELAEVRQRGGPKQVEGKLIQLGFRTADMKSRPGDDKVAAVLKVARDLAPDYPAD